MAEFSDLSPTSASPSVCHSITWELTPSPDFFYAFPWVRVCDEYGLYVCLYVYRHACTYDYTHMWRPPIDNRCLSQSVFIIFTEAESLHWTWSLPLWPVWLASGLPCPYDVQACGNLNSVPASCLLFMIQGPNHEHLPSTPRSNSWVLPSNYHASLSEMEALC